MDSKQYIEGLCAEINLEGKTPSVGLIRSRSSRQLAIKDVIETLKHWKNNPNVSKPVQEEKQDSVEKCEISLESRVATLESQVAELTQQLKRLT